MGWAVGVDGEAELMDGDVVVVPAEGDEVVGVVVAALVPFPDVMGLQPVTAAVSFDRALSRSLLSTNARIDGGIVSVWCETA